ncbi:hypothetical protein FQA39_LY15490 [Lamprigera yunnana]|nr:hypothetical protein FQA39_LY15490 [Lamprigera yunnana]
MEELNEASAPDRTSILEEGNRACRHKRKQKEPICCPVCSITLRNTEVAPHMESEVDKLLKVSTSKHKMNGKNISSTSTSNGATTSNKYWETYQKVRSNRHSRQRMKSKKRRLEETVCPVCNKETSEDINEHVDMCLRRSENNGDSDENIDVEGFEEYEWAGHSRVRATSLFHGEVANLGNIVACTEEDEDLVVDGDDAQMYGSPQYSERDIIIPGNDKEQEALRKAILGSENVIANNNSSTKITTITFGGDPTLQALKSRIRELEKQEQTFEHMFKCLICLERYKTPVISVCCWHVHCEVCWLQTLGAKKLCPQCNMITSPADLRRIYMYVMVSSYFYPLHLNGF